MWWADKTGLAQNVASLGRYLIGRDPFCIRAFTHWTCSGFAEGRGALEL